MSIQTKKRLIEDYKEIKKNKSFNIFSGPNEISLFIWSSNLIGPDNTAWKGGVVRLILEFTEDYPETPPKIKFRNSCFYHPNVYVSGELCLDILQNRWSPVYTVTSLLSSIQSLLSDPNSFSPANVSIAQLFTKNLYKYNREIQLCVEKSWNF
jgi:ubiquitin-protein ligase